MTSTDDEPRCHYCKNFAVRYRLRWNKEKSSHMRLRLCPNREQLDWSIFRS